MAKKKQEVAKVDAVPAQVEEKPARPMPEIHKEYIDACALIGEHQYRIKLAEAEVTRLVSRVFELNQEATKAQQQEAQKAAEAAKTLPAEPEKAEVK